MVNSRKFALEYEVESVGSAGIAKVEIWGTRDGGRTWASYGIEPGREGPVRVSVEGEGLYGFRITVQDGNGFGGRPPRSGDLPELWVGVDLTKPAAALTTVDLGNGEHAGELAIHWQASDALLAAHPVSLSFSDRPDGPWATIASGLDNTGVYNWRFDNRVPDHVLLRLEVRDEAGNVGEFQTPEPSRSTRTARKATSAASAPWKTKPAGYRSIISIGRPATDSSPALPCRIAVYLARCCRSLTRKCVSFPGTAWERAASEARLPNPVRSWPNPNHPRDATQSPRSTISLAPRIIHRGRFASCSATSRF